MLCLASLWLQLRYFFSRATATTLDADEDESGIRARWADFGDWQAEMGGEQVSCPDVPCGSRRLQLSDLQRCSAMWPWEV